MCIQSGCKRGDMQKSKFSIEWVSLWSCNGQSSLPSGLGTSVFVDVVAAPDGGYNHAGFRLPPLADCKGELFSSIGLRKGAGFEPAQRDPDPHRADGAGRE